MVDTRNIKNIVFDLGGVILNIDPSLTTEAFAQLGYKDFPTVYTKFSQAKLFDHFELGKITPDEFRNHIKSGLDESITTKQIDEAWNKLILDFPDERINMIQKLKSRYRLFLLSNTNKIHYDFYTRSYRSKYVFNFSALFEKAYYSFAVNMRKPDETIFKLVIKENNLLPEETLFIDDTEINVKAAVELGMKGVWLKPGETINSIGIF